MGPAAVGIGCAMGLRKATGRASERGGEDDRGAACEHVSVKAWCGRMCAWVSSFADLRRCTCCAHTPRISIHTCVYTRVLACLNASTQQAVLTCCVCGCARVFAHTRTPDTRSHAYMRVHGVTCVCVCVRTHDAQESCVEHAWHRHGNNACHISRNMPLGSYACPVHTSSSRVCKGDGRPRAHHCAH